MPDHIFKCKTGDAYFIKMLAELLTNNLKTGCLKISNKGITLRMFDSPRKTLVDLELKSENFAIYKFNSLDVICVGLNLQHFYKMLKSVKKKDSLQLFISADRPNELGIETIPKENSRITTSGIKIQNIQNIEIDIPTINVRPIIVSSSDFQKMCKELSSIGSSTIEIISHVTYIDFIADADDILKRRVRLGEIDEESCHKTNRSTFVMDQFTRINKLASLASNMYIYPGDKTTPISFKSYIGNLGHISIYIKSLELSESETYISDTYDSD